MNQEQKEVTLEPKPLLCNASILIKGENMGATLFCLRLSDLYGPSYGTKVS